MIVALVCFSANKITVFVACLEDVVCTCFGVRLSGVGIFFGKVAEEGVVAQETGEIAAALLHAHTASAAHRVGVDEGETVAGTIDAVVDETIEDVVGREVTMEKSVGVKMGGILGKGTGKGLTLGRIEGRDVGHRVAVARLQTDEVAGGTGDTGAVTYESYGFRAVEAAFLQQQRTDIGFAGTGGADVKLLGKASGERGFAIALDAEGEAVDLKGAYDIAVTMNLVAFMLEVLVDVLDVLP